MCFSDILGIVVERNPSARQVGDVDPGGGLVRTRVSAQERRICSSLDVMSGRDALAYKVLICGAEARCRQDSGMCQVTVIARARQVQSLAS